MYILYNSLAFRRFPAVPSLFWVPILLPLAASPFALSLDLAYRFLTKCETKVFQSLRLCFNKGEGQSAKVQSVWCDSESVIGVQRRGGAAPSYQPVSLC